MTYPRIKLTKRQREVVLGAAERMANSRNAWRGMCEAIDFAECDARLAFGVYADLSTNFNLFYPETPKYTVHGFEFWFPDFSQESQDARVICLLSFAEACR